MSLWLLIQVLLRHLAPQVKSCFGDFGRSIKAVDSIHIAKLRREQEELQNQPMKAVDSIAVTKARREQAQISRDVERDLLIFPGCNVKHHLSIDVIWCHWAGQFGGLAVGHPDHIRTNWTKAKREKENDQVEREAGMIWICSRAKIGSWDIADILKKHDASWRAVPRNSSQEWIMWPISVSCSNWPWGRLFVFSRKRSILFVGDCSSSAKMNGINVHQCARSPTSVQEQTPCISKRKSKERRPTGRSELRS